MENHFPEFSKREITVSTPSKMQLAIDWLKEHTEDMKLTGRELKDLRKPLGIEISHKTWNDAKKHLLN